LTLPWVTRALGLADAGRRERGADRIAEQDARRQAAQESVERLGQRASEGTVPEAAIEALRAAHRSRLLRSEISRDDSNGRGELAELHDEIELELIGTERERINDLYCENKLTDEARRRLERELDLREAHVAGSSDED
jgi:monovalent cation/hydrogen antiporter